MNKLELFVLRVIFAVFYNLNMTSRVFFGLWVVEKNTNIVYSACFSSSKLLAVHNCVAEY